MNNFKRLLETILNEVGERPLVLTKKQKAKGMNVSDLKKKRKEDAKRRKLRKHRPMKKMPAAQKSKMLKSRKRDINKV